MPRDGNQGTGKHGHKDSQEPYPHTKGQQDKGSQQSGGRGSGEQSRGQQGAGQQGAGQQGAGDDLKQREYRDNKGNVHHHTRIAGRNEDKR